MKITVDTNILISATFWCGDSDRIVSKVENKEIELFLSKDILDEFSAVLDSKEIKDKIKNKNLEFRRTVEKIIELSSIVESDRKIKAVIEDSDDDKILECAKATKVDYIISNDKHLYKLNEFEGTKILRPNEFLGMIK